MTPLPLTSLGWIAAALAATIIGMSKAGFGTGAGIVAVPLLTLATGSAQHMLPVLLPVLICGDVFSIVHYKGKINRRVLSMLAGGCILGVAAAWAVLRHLGDLEEVSVGSTTVTGTMLLNRLVGVICVSFVLVQMWRFFTAGSSNAARPPYRPALIHGVAVGTAAGLTSTLAHSAGPIIAIFMLPQKLEKSVFAGTVVAYFFVGNLIKIVPFTAQNMFTAQRLSTAFILFPFAAAGTLLGLWMNKRIRGDHFMMVLYVVTLVMGLRLLINTQ